MLIHDNGKISTRTITDEGYLNVTAYAGRAGVQIYGPGDAVYEQRPVELKDAIAIRLLRPVKEVFAEDSLKTYPLKPTTINHPPESVIADNIKKYSVGVIKNAEKYYNSVKTDLVIQDSTAIRTVEAGKNQVSLGYSADINWSGGVDPDFGDYDGVMTNIKINHLAIVDRARAGADYRLLDAAKNNQSNEETEQMSTELKDALTENGKLQAAITDAESQIQTLKTELADSETAKAKLAAELEDAKKQIVTDSEIAKRVDEGIKTRLAVVDSAREVMPKLEIDGKSTAEIQLAVIDHLTGGKSKPDAENTELVDSVFNAVLSVPKSKTKEINDALSTKKVELSDSEAARQRMMDRKAGKEVSK